MFILMYLVVTRVLLGEVLGFTGALIYQLGPIFIIIGGLILVFGAVGVPISRNLGSTVVGGIFGMLGGISRAIWRLLRELVTWGWRMTRNTFTAARRAGMNTLVATLLAALVAIAII